MSWRKKSTKRGIDAGGLLRVRAGPDDGHYLSVLQDQCVDIWTGERSALFAATTDLQ